MVVSDNGASAEGGLTGTTNEAQFFNNAPEPLEDSLAVIDEIGGPKHFNHYPWGWTWAGNTPFRRWKRETYRGGASRPVHRALAAAASRPGARCARSTRTSSTWCRPCSTCSASSRPPTISGVTQSPIHGRELRPHLRRRRRAEPAHHTQYFEMLGHRSIYHDGWRAVCPWPGPSFAEAGVGVRAADLGRHALPSSTRRGWELYHVAEDFAENHNVAAEQPRPADRADRHLVRRGRASTTSARRRQRPGPACSREKPLVAAPRDRYVYYPDTQSVPYFAGAARC